MLQALIDESDSHEIKPRIFVMGGYLAPVAKWEALTDAWRAELERCPRLWYFSFKEAFPTSGKPRGQFHGMTFEQRDARVANLRQIIEQYAEAEVGVGFQVEHYRKAYSWNKKSQNNHYAFVVPNLLPMIARHMESVGFLRQPIDFIFDKRDIDEPKVMDAWYYTRENVVNPDPPDIFDKILINPPQFRSNLDVIALQTADMFVGWTRAGNIAELNGREPMQLPGATKQLRGIYLPATEAALFEEAETSRQRLVARGLL